MLHSIDSYAARGQYIPHIDIPATVPAQPVQYKKGLGAIGFPATQEEFACIFRGQFLCCSHNICCRLHLAPISWCTGLVIHGSLLVESLKGALKKDELYPAVYHMLLLQPKALGVYFIS